MDIIGSINSIPGIPEEAHEEEGKRILAVDAVEKSWGPNYLRFGLGLSDAFYQLIAHHRRAWLNELGAEWRSEPQIGRTNSLFTEFYQPLEVSHTLFLAPYFQIERRPIDLFEGNHRIARYEIRPRLAGADLGVQMTRFGEARVGLLFGRARAHLDTGPTVWRRRIRAAEGGRCVPDFSSIS